MMLLLWAAAAFAGFDEERAQMVERQIVARGVRDPVVLKATPSRS